MISKSHPCKKKKKKKEKKKDFHANKENLLLNNQLAESFIWQEVLIIQLELNCCTLREIVMPNRGQLSFIDIL